MFRADKLNKPKFKMGDTAAWMVPKHLEAQVTPIKDKKDYRVFLPTASIRRTAAIESGPLLLN